MRRTAAFLIVTSSLWVSTTWAASSSSLDEWLAQHAAPTTVHQRIRSMASELALSALGMLDVPYKWGGNSARTGLDCSGFVKAVYSQAAGVQLPRLAAEQAQATQAIDLGQIQPGDLVFFNTMRRRYSHVGIYIGDNRFIHAPRTGAVVRVENMTQNYWQRRFNGARRVVASN